MRTWTCPTCGYRKTTADDVVAVFHPCRPDRLRVHSRPNLEEMTYEEHLAWYLGRYPAPPAKATR